MAVNLKGRSFLTLMDFTPLGGALPPGPVAGPEGQEAHGRVQLPAQGQEHRAALRKDQHAHPLRLRGGRAGRGRPRHLPGFRQFPGGQEGIHRGQRQGAGPLLRRHRVPRLQAGGRRGPGQAQRRARVERPHGHGPPDPDPRGLPHHRGARRQAPEQGEAGLLRRHPQQHELRPDVRRRQDRHAHGGPGAQGPGARSQGAGRRPRGRRRRRAPPSR